jgi:hypothetical protein
MTRAQHRAVFDHVLNNVLERGNGFNLKSALGDLINIQDHHIMVLQYEEHRNIGTEEAPQMESTLKNLSFPDQQLLVLLKAYHKYVFDQDIPILDWQTVTAEDFWNFWSNPYNAVPVLPRTSASGTVTNPPRSVTRATNKPATPADLFHHGIKRDPSLFPMLKEERFNDSWHRSSFYNQARAQGLSDVLNPTFNPIGRDQVELFKEKQVYLYTVLESKVLTDAGQAIIRKYEEEANAQKAYGELSEHHQRSTKAMIDSLSILSYIISVRIGNGEYQGTAEGFVLHWQQQVHLYQRQVPESDHFSNGQLRTMLENAVAPIKEL